MSKRFSQIGWLTPNTYDSNFSEIPNCSGVYAIVRCDINLIKKTVRRTVVYIGMSMRLSNRLKAHPVLARANRRFPYVQVFFKRCEPEFLRAMESGLIKQFNPIYNVIGKEMPE